MTAIAIVAVLCAVLTRGPSAGAAEPTLPISKVQSGMVGYAKTVATGTAITTFTVQVIDVVSNQNNGDFMPTSHLILFRASGPLIDQTGGIVEGMSGSPVYLKDSADGIYKIAGAVSYGFELADATVAFATPIDEMLPLLDLSSAAAAPVRRPARYMPLGGKPIGLGGGRIMKSAVSDGTGGLLPAGTQRLRRLSAPITVMGMNPGSHSYARLSAALQQRGFRVTAAPRPSAPGFSFSGATIEPGSTLGVGLVTGDTTVAAMGTVTYVDGTGVIGFGHPMYWQGAMTYPMMTGYVHTIVPSIRAGFKLASAGDTTGTITQDRATGVAGTLGTRPAATTITARATNANAGGSVTKTYHVAPGVMPDVEFAWLVAGTLLDSTNHMVFDSVGQGTADTTFTIRGHGATGRSFSLDYGNKVYGSYDIAGEAASDFAMSLMMLLANGYEDVTLTTASYSSRITSANQTAEIVDASLLGRRIVRGSTMTVRAYVQPYNSDTLRSVDVTLAIPRSLPAGATLRVESNEESDYSDSPAMPGVASPGSIDDLISELEGQQRNNEMQITLAVGGGDDEPPGVVGTVSSTSVTKRFATQWVLSSAVSKNVSSISLATRPNPVVYHRAVTFSGRVADLADPYSPLETRPRVELWAKPYGSSTGRMVASTLGNQRTGAYSISYAPTSTTRFWTRFVGSDTVLDANSASRSVKVKAAVTLRLWSVIVRLGRNAAVAGGVRPLHVGTLLYLQRRSGRRWVTIKTTRINPRGDFGATWRPTRRGTYLLRAWWRDSNSSHLSNASAARTLRVI